jgi:hypothetical protein
MHSRNELLSDHQLRLRVVADALMTGESINDLSVRVGINDGRILADHNILVAHGWVFPMKNNQGEPLTPDQRKRVLDQYVRWVEVYEQPYGRGLYDILGTVPTPSS